jgi:hypothetical protein
LYTSVQAGRLHQGGTLAPGGCPLSTNGCRQNKNYCK